MTNLDPSEISKFDAMAKEWWDPNGPMKPLHDLNPLRLSYILDHCGINTTNSDANLRVLDIGCGAGILTESIARKGLNATGIDLSEKAIQIAKKHAETEGVSLDYHCIATEDFEKNHQHAFDIITCMEMLEHVPDPSSIIQSATNMLKPGGTLFFSTINRNPKAFLAAIVGAEYILRLLPRGTHEYQKFIRPSELTKWAKAAGLVMKDLTGMSYNPFTGVFKLTDDVSINYFMCFKK